MSCQSTHSETLGVYIHQIPPLNCVLNSHIVLAFWSTAPRAAGISVFQLVSEGGRITDWIIVNAWNAS